MTGTDTGVGKTHISAALLHWLTRDGLIAAGFKPVAAGATLINGVSINDDVRMLREASSATATDAEVGPFQFETACAPHIAAALERRSIDRGARQKRLPGSTISIRRLLSPIWTTQRCGRLLACVNLSNL